MGKHITPYKYPGRISSSRFARNDGTPHAGAWRKIAQGTNFCAQRMRRMVASYGYPCIAGFAWGPQGAAGTTHPWHFPFRSGVNASQLDFIISLPPPDSGSATDPRVRLRLRDIDAGTNTYSEYIRYANIDSGASSNAWRSLSWAQGAMLIPAEQTFYRLSVECEDYGRVQSICAFERAPDLADDAQDGVCDPTAFEDNGQILDADIQSVLAAQTKLWQANARHLFGYTQANTSSARSVSSTTYTNVLDGVSTSVTSTTPGVTLLTQYHNTRSSTTVPAELGIYANDTAGTGTLSIRAQSASGTLWEVTGIDMTGSANQTQVFDASFAANSGETKYDIQAKVSDGSTTYEIYALALWEYEA